MVVNNKSTITRNKKSTQKYVLGAKRNIFNYVETLEYSSLLACCMGMSIDRLKTLLT